MQRAIAISILLALAATPHAAAVAEADAPAIDPRILNVSHAPEVPEPGTQWTGRIELAEGHNITEVRYQICRVGKFCFAPPTLADQLDANTWTFDTSDYLAAGRPVDWGINFRGSEAGDWDVGVQYVFTTSDGEALQHVPHGVDETSDECDEMGWDACAATHYFVFTMPGREPAPEKGASAPGALLALAAVAFAGVAFRGRR